MAGTSIRLDAKRSGPGLTLKPKLPPILPFGGNRGRVERLDEKAGFEWVGEALTRTQEALETLWEAEELHRLLFVKVPQPRFVCDAKTLRILAVNEATVRQYKYSRHEFHRMRVIDLSAPESVADFKKYCQELSSSRGGAVDGQDNVFRHHRKDGSLIDVEIEAAVIPLRGKRLFLLLAQDVTEKRRAQQRLRAHQATTHALAESYTLTEAGPKIFRAICENLGGDWGELWTVDPAANVLRCAQTWHPASQRLPRVERATRDLGFARGEGIPGSVWAHNKPLWIADISQQPAMHRKRALDKFGLRTVFAFPIRLNREVLGVITVFSRRVLPPDKHLLQLLKDICSQIGQVMGRRRAERQLLEISEREQQRIGRDLHDGLCQQLAGIAYIASNLQSTLAKVSPKEATVAARIAELSRATAVQARQIARGLNPVNLGAMGLVAALEELTSSIGTMFAISCRFESTHRVRIRDHGAAVHLYRITQEAIHNSITHGKATEIRVSLHRKGRGTVLSVIDNGRGLSNVSVEDWGMGIENMNCRARAIGARLQFAPCRGGGTIMCCTLPSRVRRAK
ncbi:MAG TPA: GAF domain-containing protein [Verrucomicrobiae bacterium]|nr:GAF domain-containing protein [Verrucomicrobiae bacterium]